MTHRAERLLWIDIAKGLGIFLVVVGHVLLRSAWPDATHIAALIYLFHMPLFFVVAGLTLKPEPLGFYARRKAVVLLIPYAVFLCLLGIPTLVATCGFGIAPADLGVDRCPIMAVKLLAGGSLLGGIFGAFWFIPCLLGSLMLAQLVLQISSRSLKSALAVCSLLALIAYGLPSLIPHSTALFSLGTMPMACLFLLAGFSLKNHLPRLSTPILLFLSLITALAAVLPTTMDMKAASYGVPMLSVLASVALTCLVLWLSSFIAKWRTAALLTAAWGQRSLTVLYLHQAVHLSLRHFQCDNDPALIALSLLVPTLLHRPLGQLLLHLEAALNAHLFKNSPASSPQLR